MPVAAACHLTIIQARIGLILVAVVTGLNALRDHPIAAALNCGERSSPWGGEHVARRAPTVLGDEGHQLGTRGTMTMIVTMSGGRRPWGSWRGGGARAEAA